MHRPVVASIVDHSGRFLTAQGAVAAQSSPNQQGSGSGSYSVEKQSMAAGRH